MRLTCMVGVIAITFFAAAAQAQPYPTKPVRYVVAFAAGDAPDIVARLVGDRLGKMWDQQVLVENRVGAGGTIAAAFVAKAPADGYTLFACNIASNAIAPAVYLKLPYDALRDFATVSRIATTANVVLVHPSLAVKSIGELLDFAKANPGKLSYGSSGIGTSPHLSMELFKLIARIDVVHVPYKGASPAAADLIGGQIPLMMANLPSVLPLIQSGKARALAVTSQTRAASLPAVPTMIESGIADYIVTAWYGLCTPAGTSTVVLNKLHADLLRTLQMPDVRQRLTDLLIDIAPTSSDEFAAFIRSELDRWAKVVKAASIPRQ